MRRPGRTDVADGGVRTSARVSTPFRIGWLAVLVVTVTARAQTLSSWSWLQDDLLLTSDVPGKHLGPYLVQSVAGHVFPGELLLAWVFTKLDPLDFTWAALSICVFAGLVVVGWGLALRELFGERVHLLVALVVLALSPGMTLASHWWISALNLLPMQASMGFCVWFVARYLRRGRRVADLVGLNVSYALGLFMWEKTLLVTIPLLFVCLLLGPAGPRRSLAAAVRVLWPTALVTLGYLAFYVWAVRDTPAGAPPVEYARTVGSAASLVASGTINTVLPSLVGGPFGLPDSSLSVMPSTSGAIALLLWSAAVVLALVAVVFRRRGALALTMLAFYAAVSWGLVFFSDRFPAVGPSLLGLTRYSADVLCVALLACLFVLTPTRGEVAPLRRPVSADALRWIRRGSVVFLVLVSIACAVNSGRAWDTIRPASTKPYMDNLVGDARALGRATVYDTAPPPRLVDPILLADAAHVSAILGPLHLPLTYDRPTERFVVADDEGHFREADVVGGRHSVTPGPDGDCVYAVNPGQATRIPMDGDLFDLDWAMELTYFTGSDAKISVRTDKDQVDVDLPTNKVGGLGKRQLIVSGPVTSLTLEGLDGKDTVCVTDVRIGIVKASNDVPKRLRD